MNNTKNNYITSNKQRKAVFCVLCAFALAAGLLIGISGCRAADERPATMWILCKPGATVNVRRTPDRDGQIVGYMEVGDDFRTYGKTSNGFVRAEGIGEYGEAWIYTGYVVSEEPERIGSTYVCTSNARVACRRWVDGPQVSGRPWIVNGSTVQVFYIADGWAVTNRGYIKAEYLEADPS